MVATTILCQNPVEFKKTNAYNQSYQKNHILPNQTKPTQKITKASVMVATTILSTNPLEFFENVAYSLSYQQNHS